MRIRGKVTVDMGAALVRPCFGDLRTVERGAWILPPTNVTGSKLIDHMLN